MSSGGFELCQRPSDGKQHLLRDALLQLAFDLGDELAPAEVDVILHIEEHLAFGVPLGL